MIRPFTWGRPPLVRAVQIASTYTIGTSTAKQVAPSAKKYFGPLSMEGVNHA
jgi:hypothetical protein